MLNWQKKMDYGKRALVEVAFSRYERIFGKMMQCVNFDNQKIEAQLACKALNRMLSLGMPQTVKMA